MSAWLPLPAPAALFLPHLFADHISKDLLQYYQRLLASQPSRRLNPKQLLEAGVLRNRLAEATSFLDNLAIKDSAEKARTAGAQWQRSGCPHHLGWVTVSPSGLQMPPNPPFHPFYATPRWRVQDMFFKKLPSLLPSVPTLVAQRKLLPMLANAIEFGGAPPVRQGRCSCQLLLLPRHCPPVLVEQQRWRPCC